MVICDCNVIHHDIVDTIRDNIIKQKDLTTLAKFFKVLGDETRVRILWCLDQSEMCVCDICNVLGMNKSAVSHQLKFLRDAKLVKFRKEGKTVYYSLDDEHVRAVFETAREHIGEIKDEESI